jgi:hypothetical protein
LPSAISGPPRGGEALSTVSMWFSSSGGVRYARECTFLNSSRIFYATKRRPLQAEACYVLITPVFF